MLRIAIGRRRRVTHPGSPFRPQARSRPTSARMIGDGARAALVCRVLLLGGELLERSACTLFALEIDVPPGSEDDLLRAVLDQWPSLCRLPGQLHHDRRDL